MRVDESVNSVVLSDQDSWSVLDDAADDVSSSSSSSYSMLAAGGDFVSSSSSGVVGGGHEQEEDASWSILSSNTQLQNDDGSTFSSSISSSTPLSCCWADISSSRVMVAAAPPSTSSSTDLIVSPPAARITKKKKEHSKLVRKITTTTTTSTTMPTIDETPREECVPQNARGGRPASMFGKNTRTSKWGTTRTSDRYSRNGEHFYREYKKRSNQRHWKENRIGEIDYYDDYYDDESYYYEEDEDEEDDEDDYAQGAGGGHDEDYYNAGIATTKQTSRSNNNKNKGSCAICMEEKPLVPLMKACRCHPSSCYDCLRKLYVVEDPQDDEEQQQQYGNRYPLYCFWPECDNRLRNHQIQRLVKTQEEMDRHYRAEKEAQSVKHEMTRIRAACKMVLTKFSPEEILSIMAALLKTSSAAGGGRGDQQHQHHGAAEDPGCEDGLVFCLRCARLLLKEGGCDHVTCLCGYEFSFLEARKASAILHGMIAKERQTCGCVVSTTTGTLSAAK